METRLSKRTRDFRRLLSYHEASHAVVACKLGVGIVDVDLTETDDYVANVPTQQV